MFNGKLNVSELYACPATNWHASITCNGIKVADVVGKTEKECKARAEFFCGSANLNYLLNTINE